MNSIHGVGYVLGTEKQAYDRAASQAKMQAEGQVARDTSPVEMALDQLQKVIEVGHEEMLELRARLIPVTDQGNEKSCSLAAGSSSPLAPAPSQIEDRLAHMIDRAAILQGSLREMRIRLRI